MDTKSFNSIIRNQRKKSKENFTFMGTTFRSRTTRPKPIAV